MMLPRPKLPRELAYRILRAHMMHAFAVADLERFARELPSQGRHALAERLRDVAADPNGGS